HNPVPSRPMSGGKFRFLSWLSCASMRCLYRPAWGCIFFFCPLCHFAMVFCKREARCFSAGKAPGFVSEGFSRQLPLATAAHKRLTRPQQGGELVLLVSFPYLALKIAHRATRG